MAQLSSFIILYSQIRLPLALNTSEYFWVNLGSWLIGCFFVWFPSKVTYAIVYITSFERKTANTLRPFKTISYLFWATDINWHLQHILLWGKNETCPSGPAEEEVLVVLSRMARQTMTLVSTEAWSSFSVRWKWPISFQIDQTVFILIHQFIHVCIHS